jgi:hypothetical protein
MKNKKEVKLAVILFAILYLSQGLGYLIGGANTDIRFYNLDNLLIRFIGLIFILSSIGLFFRKEIARKGMILALSLSIVEIFIGVTKHITIDFIIGSISILIFCAPGLVYFSVLKNTEYFN